MVKNPTGGGATGLVLVVEDTPATRKIMGLYLTMAGYTVKEVGNAAEALSWLAANEPDAILLDVMMPGMSGYELAARLRVDARLKDVPILLCTALTPEPGQLDMLAKSGLQYIGKPFKKDELLTKVAGMVKK